MIDVIPKVKPVAINRFHHVLVVDESGSMSMLQKMVKSSFSETFKQVEDFSANQNETHVLTIVTFNSNITELLNSSHITSKNKEHNSVMESVLEKYTPSGSTRLLDAIGRGIAIAEQETQGKETTAVLVTIITDGEENASRDESSQSITEKINELSLNNWTFIYIGANQDAHKTAAGLGIKLATNFTASLEGYASMSDGISNARGMYVTSNSLGLSAQEINAQTATILDSIDTGADKKKH